MEIAVSTRAADSQLVHGCRLGFTRPTPVQHEALPVVRTGINALVQAKSGTGKTLVFALLCVEKCDQNSPSPQAGPPGLSSACM